MVLFDPHRYAYPSRRSVVYARRAMACTSVPLGAQVGLDVMKAGGNAVDAAVAMAAAMPLLEPTGNGIGGACFALVWVEREKKLYGLNASGVSPAALSAALVRERGFGEMPKEGWLPTMVPGAPGGWAELNRRFGTRPLEELFAPAASYAREEEGELIARLGQGDPEARARLIEHNLRLVVYIARRFENTGINIEDLISIGTIGLIKAVGTYQPAKSIKLATYASRCIENEILMHLRKTSSQKTELSLDEPLNTDWDGNELLLSDVLGTENDLVMRPIEADVDRQLLRQALDRLEPRERHIISLRFGLDGAREQTQKEVADRLGISQSYISRLEKRIIARLKKEIVRMM